MGCDGGTIPRRDELVRLKKKPEQKDKESELAYRWRHCAITQQPLQEPIVMCGLGRLYSKQNVIEHLLDKDKMPESAMHIRSLRDVRNLNLSPNPAYKDCGKLEGMVDVRSAPYICKLIGLEMTGKFRFVALWTCGCVFSERALKEINSSVCSLCQTPFTDQDVVILNGNEEEAEAMVAKMEARTAKLRADKKDKKSKKSKSAAVETVTVTSSSVDAETIDEPTSSKIVTVRTDMLQGKDVPGVTAGVAALKAGSSSKATTSAGPVKPFLKRDSADPTDHLTDPAIKKLKGNSFSVAADPKASDVYKSLFTTHKSEQEQTRAHWVTYNPFYN